MIELLSDTHVTAKEDIGSYGELTNYLYWHFLGFWACWAQGFARETFPKSWTVSLHMRYCICLPIQKNSREDLRLLESVFNVHNLKFVELSWLLNFKESKYVWLLHIVFEDASCSAKSEKKSLLLPCGMVLCYWKQRKPEELSSGRPSFYDLWVILKFEVPNFHAKKKSILFLLFP